MGLFEASPLGQMQQPISASAARLRADLMRDSALATAWTQKGLQIADFNLMDGAVGSIALEDDAVTQAKIAAAAVLAPELGVTAGTVTANRAIVAGPTGAVNALATATLTVSGSAVSMAALPTIDPGFPAGQLWNDGGTLKIT